MATATLPTLDTPLVIAGREFRSRLMVGTGKYASNHLMVRAIEASGAEVVTVAVRRVDLDRSKDEGVLHHLDPSRAIPGRVRAALDTLTEGLLVIDRKQNIVLANESFSKLVGKTPDNLLGQQASKLAWMAVACRRFLFRRG